MQEKGIQVARNRGVRKQSIKCVVWDLDNTLWDGTLLEDEHVFLRPGVVETITALDSRGILHSIASKNDEQLALRKLEEFGLKDYFLYPQINWNSKVSSIKAIAQALNISLDTFAFVDDQPFELEEVAFSLPEVLCFNVSRSPFILSMPEMQPRFQTEDSKMRRLMYLNDIQRKQAEEEFEGPGEAFLSTLQMVFTIAPACEEDLKRAEELTVRTHQLNTTGYTYSYDELCAFSHSPDHLFLMAGLTDRFGSYGKIGLALVERESEVWTIKLLLMSCRVMSRGGGAIMISYLRQLARDAHVRLCADFRVNDRNRMMYMTYKFNGFREIQKNEDMVLLENDLSQIPSFPSYVTVHADAGLLLSTQEP